MIDRNPSHAATRVRARGSVGLIGAGSTVSVIDPGDERLEEWRVMGGHRN
jgi:hypothetical protein